MLEIYFIKEKKDLSRWEVDRLVAYLITHQPDKIDEKHIDQTSPLSHIAICLFTGIPYMENCPFVQIICR